MRSNPFSVTRFPSPAHWVQERVRELSLWPINLVRDFPARMGRIGRTVEAGLRGLFLFVPELFDAPEKKVYLRVQLGRLVAGLHQLGWQIFDLIGGPEVIAFVLHLFAYTTPLTEQEVKLATAVFGEKNLRYQDVRIVQGGLFDLIFKWNGNLAFATWYAINLPRNGRHTRDQLPILIHELAHVYQYEQIGSRYLGEAIYVLVKTKRDCYNYGGVVGLQSACRQGQTFADFNREQQAMLVQDYFTRTQQGIDVTDYEPFIAQLRDEQI